ncbi:MAG: biotin--[acetyl-CoA-carboxylase] ligase [Prevotella sp.]|nr:biotin--[acetyl-CoA-carboxylase] ligase [Staphylococcus sp.]MCM1350111.1 biotin--[acetyl-CoA-carboxylase] ligase [Prevotella sp.]
MKQDGTTNQILAILKQYPNQLLSGSRIAQYANVTRSYVSKVIQSLMIKGYDIESVNRVGYIYHGDQRVLSETKISSQLHFPKEVMILEEVDSTNTFLKRLAKTSNIEELVVVANQQTGGRGRIGRTYVSNPTSGIYFSILYRPKIAIEYAKKLTCLAGVAVVRAIQKLTGLEAKIKWVNDVYLHGKKVCGILTEASTSVEENTFEYAIIGIGVNCYQQNFSKEVAAIATTIEDEANCIVSRNDLIAEIINQIDTELIQIENSHFMEEYRTYSFVIGKEVELQKMDESHTVKVIDITKDGELVVEEKGKIYTISSGEITRMVVQSE